MIKRIGIGLFLGLVLLVTACSGERTKSTGEGQTASLNSRENGTGGNAPGAASPSNEQNSLAIVETKEQLERALHTRMKDFPDDGDWSPLDVQDFNNARHFLPIKLMGRVAELSPVNPLVEEQEAVIYLWLAPEFPAKRVTIKGRRIKVGLTAAPVQFRFPITSKPEIRKLREGHVVPVVANVRLAIGEGGLTYGQFFDAASVPARLAD